MATSFKFSSLPNINIPRTLLDVECTHPTSFQHGKIVPLFCIPVGPAENYKLWLNSLIRMHPIFPFYGDIKCFAHSFYVPMRLLFDKTPEFFGENVLTKGPQPTEYHIPMRPYGRELDIYSDAEDIHYGEGSEGLFDFPVVHSVSHYLGKPLRNQAIDPTDYYENTDTEYQINLSVLKERGYWAIYNEYYRPQQLIDPIYVDTGVTSAIGKDPNRKVGLAPQQAINLSFASEVATCTKMYDYFRSATIAPIYSDEPVTVPLGKTAPLAVQDKSYYPDGFDGTDFSKNTGWNVKFGSSDVSFEAGDNTAVYRLMNDRGNNNIALDDSEQVRADMPTWLIQGNTGAAFQTNLVTDLRSAAGINVDEIRYLFAVYNYLYRDNFGSRFPEIIQTHFSIKPSIAVLQRPEILHEGSFNINVSQVLSTAGATDSTDTKLGQPGANSVTANRQLVVNRSFDEWGFVYIMIETKHKRVYSAGVDAYDLRKNKFDFYFPEFATIGNKKIQVQEVSVDTPSQESVNPDAAWAYQEAWAEERYFRNHVSGLLDPRAPSSYGYMTLADATPSDAGVGLSKEWILEDRNAISRVLVTGEAGDDYSGDFALTGVMAKPMPLYSEPGLIDHIGMW